MRIRHAASAAVLLVSPVAAAAQESADPAAPPTSRPFTVSSSVAILTDYRLRGVSQSDRRPALQGALTVAHESGLYVGTFASNLAGWGTFGGSNLELDAIGGYRHAFGSATVDAGLTWYMYPGGAAKTDFAEPYAKLTGTAGRATLTAGAAYAPRQQAIGRWYASGAAAAANLPNNPGKGNDNLYLWGDFAAAVPNTPLTAKAHIGHSDGNSGLGPNGTSAAPTGHYWDWLLGADYAIKGTPLTLSAYYVDTDISKAKAAYLQPNFASTKDGSTIAGSQVVFSISAAF